MLTKKMQLDLSSKIAKELLKKGLKEIDYLTRETIHMMTKGTCGDYIMSLKVVEDDEMERLSRRNQEHTTWNMFFTNLKFDVAYQTRGL